MSMDKPNEYELMIENYADSVRSQIKAEKDIKLAQFTLEKSLEHRQTLWRLIAAEINKGNIKPGIYRLNKSSGLYCEGILIEEHHDYPEVFPMFR